MKVYLPLMIQDPATGGEKIVEGIHIAPDRDLVADFADGPSTSLVVVEDFDPATGERLPPVRFVPPGRGRKMGRYVVPDDIYSNEFIRVAVLGAVLKTMRFFADESALGREIRWAFDHPRLRVLPRAGEAANAFYDRESGTLQFFYFKNPHDRDQTIFTSLSRDIVAHETGHALVDAIAPALYDAMTPQSLAVHEALADLTALMTAFQSNSLRLRVLELTRGSIRDPNAFSSLAPEFGRALDESGRAGALRSLWNDKTLDPEDRSIDERGKPNSVDRTDPHALSEVLSGALYRVMVRMYEQKWAGYGGGFSASGRALADALRTFQRLVFHAVDFLPPGDASFADYCRAISAGNKTSFVTWGNESHWLAEELQRRHVIGAADEILRNEPEGLYGVKSLEAETLIGNDAEAQRFVNRNRTVFNVPPRVPISVHPRFRTSKGSGWGKEWDTERTNEILLKISWEQIEEDSFDRHFPTTRGVTCGTTVVLNFQGVPWHILSVGVEAQRAERDRMVRSLLESGLLRQGLERREASGPVGPPIRVDVRKGVMRISGAGRLLHQPTRQSPERAP
jgi:hypothetical protein